MTSTPTPPRSRRVLLTDGEERAALAACRGLARGRYRVSCVAATRLAPGHWSRCCDRRLLAPSPLRHPQSFLVRLEEILSVENHDLLLPASDAALLAVSNGRHRLEPLTRLGLPPHEVIEQSVDKLELLEKAAAVDLASPASMVCREEGDAKEAAKHLGFPLVVKPSRSLVPTTDGSFRVQPALIVRNERSLPAAISAAGAVFIAQRYVDGGSVVSCGGVFAGGQLLADAVSRYRRTWNPLAGSACSSETISAPAALTAKVEELVAAMGWSGIFEVELLDLGDGRYSVLDFNPRVYGSLALANMAGANLAAIWCDWLLGRSRGRVSARSGIAYRWEDAELRHFLWQVRRRRFRAALRVLRPLRRVAYAHFAPSDPGPLLARALFLIGIVATRARAKRD